jgi:phosphoglycerol transferase MdoB-like AlkP superfamily enzyme
MKLPIKSRTLPCIAASLNENGYHSSFLYGGDINFTNMQSYLRTGGYGTIVSDVDFTQEERETNDWGVNDDITFERLHQMMDAQKHTPWHIGFLTLSSHEPWQVPTHRLKEEIPNALAFTDECLGKFVESIRQTPLWKDLLIVCIPDHGVSYPDGLEQIKIQHNTMLWIGGAVKQASTIETIMNQSDMAATLLGQLRIDHSGYLFSRDIFSSNYVYPTAYFATREGAGFIDSLGYTVHSIVQEDSFTDKAERERARKAKAILQTSYEDLGAR